MPPLFTDIVGQELAVDLLRRSLARGAAHAYLFAGPAGVGKTAAALEFAAGLACDAAGCGECDVCRRVRQGIHPDVHLVAAEGAVITVDQVREINREVALRPYEARARVYLILEAESMNKEAANAFLKTLEEPPPHAFFLLISAAPEELLPTVASRCQRVLFTRTPPGLLTQHLREVYGLSEVEAAAFARVSQGSLERARLLAGDSPTRERRARLLAWAREIPQAELIDLDAILDEMLSSAEKTADRRATALEAERDRELEWAHDARTRSRVEKAYETRIKRERRRVATESLRETLDTFATWYRDLLAVALGTPETVLNGDYALELEGEAFSALVPAYLEVLAVLKGAQERFRYNVDARCAFQDMVLAMKEALP